METNYLQNVKFQTVSSSFPSSVDDGLRAPFVGIFVGQPGQGKSYEMSQYAKHSIEHHDYDGMFALCSEYIANAQYFDHIPCILDAFPEEYIHDKDKVFAWLDYLATWNRKRMDEWRKIQLQYKSWDEFKNSKTDFNDFIKKREEKFVPLSLESIGAPKKKPKKVEESKIDVLTTTPNPLLASRALDYNPWRNFIKINSTPAAADLSEEIMRKVKRYYCKPPLCILYGDDLLGTPMMANTSTNKLINKAISLRHDGFTFLLGVQAWTGGLPRTIRINAKIIVIHQTADDKLLKSFYDETLSSVCNFKDFKEFFNNVIDGDKHKFLLVDRMQMPIQIRLNWNIIGVAKDMIPRWLLIIRQQKLREEESSRSLKRVRSLRDDSDELNVIKKLKYY